jgi:hypothetical protein
MVGSGSTPDVHGSVVEAADREDRVQQVATV